MTQTRRRLLAAALGVACAPVARLFAAALDDASDGAVLLVAKPDLTDANFRDTVVCVMPAPEGVGTLGLILNKPLAARLADAAPEAGGLALASERIYHGGPLAQNRILFLLQSEVAPANSLRLLDDVFLSADAGLPQQIVRGEIAAQALRAYIGYAAWAPRQLKAEIAAGAWLVTAADASTIFSADAPALWPAMIKRLTTRTAHGGWQGAERV